MTKEYFMQHADALDGIEDVLMELQGLSNIVYILGSFRGGELPLEQQDAIGFVLSKSLDHAIEELEAYKDAVDPLLTLEDVDTKKTPLSEIIPSKDDLQKQ